VPTVTLADLQKSKEEGRKSVGVVVWDYQLARIVDRVGVDLVSVGDTVGVNLWGHENPLSITLDEVLIACRAVRRGVRRALLCCDLPFGPLQRGRRHAVDAAVRLAKEGGVDLVKLDGAGDYPEAVEAITRAGIPVFAQFGITPQTGLRHGVAYSAAAGAEVPPSLTDELVATAKRLEAAGAVLLDFTNSGPVAGPAVVAEVGIPVLGGFGGGPWLDGRMRLATAAIGYPESNLDTPADTYANVARVAFDAITAYTEDVRAGRQIRGGVR
jgi:3-methyl-2-oxobutanoate hydroxymethyltransferase